MKSKIIFLSLPGRLLLLIPFLLLISCSVSVNSGNKVGRNDVVGTWELSETSQRQPKEKLNVFQFSLKPDSTASITMGNVKGAVITGNWVWKKKKQIGNDRFGLSIQTDVVLYLNNKLVLGMILKEHNGKLQLRAGGLSYVKSDDPDQKHL